MTDKVILYGVNSINTQKAFEYVTKELGKEVVAVSDRNTDFRGKEFFGVPCVSPDDLPKHNATVFLCNGSSIRAVEADMRIRGVDFVSAYSFVTEREKAKFDDVYQLFDDDFSRQTFKAMIDARLTTNYDILRPIIRPVLEQYFSFWNFEYPYMIYVDVGAYNGATVENYLMNFAGAQKIFAFEPMENSFRALVYRSERLEREFVTNIKCEKMCLSNYKGTVQMLDMHGDFASRIARGNTRVNGGTIVTTLDDYLNGEKIDFIKADIEGEELNMLLGAKETIVRHKPRLAICAYHTVWDLYEIPLLLKKLNLGYKFAYRHYSTDFNENVIYAWV
jgi:FkbM family methyltransferase